MKISHKRETIEGYYNQNDREYKYTLEVIIRDDSGRNDTFDVIWEDDQPDDVDTVEDAIVDEYFNKQTTSVSDYTKLNKVVDALYSALTCTWEDNGNIMADAVRDFVLSVLSDITGKSITEIENEVIVKVEKAQ